MMGPLLNLLAKLELKVEDLVREVAELRQQLKAAQDQLRALGGN